MLGFKPNAAAKKTAEEIKEYMSFNGHLVFLAVGLFCFLILVILQEFFGLLNWFGRFFTYITGIDGSK